MVSQIRLIRLVQLHNACTLSREFSTTFTNPPWRVGKGRCTDHLLYLYCTVSSLLLCDFAAVQLQINNYYYFFSYFPLSCRFQSRGPGHLPAVFIILFVLLYHLFCLFHNVCIIIIIVFMQYIINNKSTLCLCSFWNI